MADHTVTLTPDEENALADAAAGGSIDALLAKQLHSALQDLVDRLKMKQANAMQTLFLALDGLTRADMAAAIAQPTPTGQIAALKTALDAAGLRLQGK